MTGTADYAATEQHIRLLQAKRATLAAALADAESQYAMAVKREFDAGTIGWAELNRAYGVVRDGGLRGWGPRWRSVLPYSGQKLRGNARLDPDHDVQQWSGQGMHVHLHQDRPATGTGVVYVLFADDGTAVYVGSTQKFTSRLGAHRRDGKTWASWLAHRCRDRDHAYEVEARFLEQYMPRDNRCAGRRSA